MGRNDVQHAEQASRLSRRQVIAGAAGLAAAASLPGAGRVLAQDYSGRQIVMASFGGQWEQAQMDSFVRSFTERTGATVVTAPYDFARLRTMVSLGETPEWDVVGISSDEFYAAVRANIVQKVDTSLVDTSRIDPKFMEEYGVGSGIFSWVLGHNTDLYAPGEEPKTWADLFDFERFPGVRAIGDRVNPMLEIALLADGVAVEGLYPLDLDRAFAKLDELKGNSILWTTHAQALQLLGSGETPMGLASSTRIFAGRRDGVPVAAGWNQNIQSDGFMSVVTGSENAELAWILIDEMTKAENQAFMAEAIGLSPSNPAAFEHLSKEISDQLPTSPQNADHGILINKAYWDEHLLELEERWTAWRLA